MAVGESGIGIGRASLDYPLSWPKIVCGAFHQLQRGLWTHYRRDYSDDVAVCQRVDSLDRR